MSCKRIPNMDRHQSKRNSVMPAHAGIQSGGGGARTENLDSRFHGNDGSAKRRLVAVIGAPRFPINAS
jgi:hypothetical protein